MDQLDINEYTQPKQTSESLEICMAIVRQTLLRHHSADYIEKNPAIFAACMQAFAIDSAAKSITSKLDEIVELLKSHE